MSIFRGKKYRLVHTIDIHFQHIRAVFFPKTFYEKYKYLGSVPIREDGDYFKALYPLVLAMDYAAKPRFCPRWVLRFLHLFGSDNSIIRVRNLKLYNLKQRLTGGILLVDWKTKWSDYDLRISVYGPKHLQNLAEAIEAKFYREGYRADLMSQIRALDPNSIIFDCTISSLEKKLEELEKTK